MATKNFRKEEFREIDGKYEIEFNMQEIGEGSNLTIEMKKNDDEYEVVQAEVNRHDDSLFVVWSEPFDGRLIFWKLKFRNYQEAIKHKKESLKNADKNVLENFHLIITPAITNESAKYIDDFLKNPDDFTDESCKKYCSDGEFKVVSFKKENFYGSA